MAKNDVLLDSIELSVLERSGNLVAPVIVRDDHLRATPLSTNLTFAIGQLEAVSKRCRRPLNGVRIGVPQIETNIKIQRRRLAVRVRPQVRMRVHTNFVAARAPEACPLT